MDAEFFKKSYVHFLKKIKQKGVIKIGDVSFVTDGIHESIDFDTESNINLISAKSPKENYFDLSSNHYISESHHYKNPRTQLKPNDVIISTVGTIGNCAVVKEDILPANSDRHVGIIRIKEKLKPYFLSTFLLSKYGRFQTFRESTGNVQLNLFIYKIKELLVPDLSDLFQEQIEKLCKTSFEYRTNSSVIYTQAESILLQEIGLNDFEPSKKAVNIKSFSKSFATTGRLDAEYYQPKYEQYENLIKSQKHTYVKDEYLHIVKKSKKEKTGYNYIEIGDVNIGNGSNSSNYVLTDDLPANAKTLVQKGDILISNVRPYRGAVTIIDSDITDLIVSGAFTVLRKNPNSIFNNQVLQVLLRSKVYKDWVLKYNVGTSYPVIKDKDILELPIPFIDTNKQEKIASLIDESFALKKQSEHLLEVAKKAVQIAIENNEQVALNYINENTN